ncbi:MAG TPA: diphosphate--fructose-6-phosphate 1-phosphotransferase [Planctomycetota bacterium]|nr:diphosphate--fructose-6-phosphate 1-phosphotransferase [Planctomycetota bacterium]
MADSFRGSALFVQSGVPTAVINASVAAAVQEAAKTDCIDRLLAAHGGLLGVLQEDLFDLRKERAEDIENLKRTPSAALGSCRHQVESAVDLERIQEVLAAHNVRFLFLAGGREAMAAADRIGAAASARGHELRVLGIPAASDNSLACTDHCPGFASAAKLVATRVMEAGRDTEALRNHTPCTVREITGRSSGWLAAATGLARRSPEDAPHLIYVPERLVSLDTVTSDVRECLRLHGRCFVAAAEGLRDARGERLAESGTADFLRDLIQREVGVRCRAVRGTTAQRAAMHFASLADVSEAAEAGLAAVRKAARGQSGVMITLVREPGPVYRCSTGTARLSDVAAGEHLLPPEFLGSSGNGISEAMKEYARPLLRGEAPINLGPEGLPVFVRLQKRPVPKKLAEWNHPVAAG